MAASISSFQASEPAAPSLASVKCSRRASPASKSLRWSRSNRRSCRAASPGRTRFRASAPVSCRAVLDRGVIDEVVTIDSATAIETARHVARLEGVPVGISSGAAVAAALQVAARPSSEGKNDRHHHSFLRRTLSLDGSVRRALIAGVDKKLTETLIRLERIRVASPSKFVRLR